MISIHEIANVMHGNVQSTDGEKIGRVGQVYVDNKTGEPEWVTVHTGLFGSQHSFVPLARATLSGSDIHVPFDKATVKDAPRVEADGELTPTEEDELYAYYRVQGGDEHGAETTNTGRDLIGELGGVGHNTTGPTTNHAMTSSEEQLKVGTEKAQTGTAKLRKYIVTEQQTTTVPISRGEVTVVGEPIIGTHRGEAMADGDLSKDHHEAAPHPERPVVEKEAVILERIELDTITVTVTEHQPVTEGVRTEHVEVHDDATGQHTEHDHR